MIKKKTQKRQTLLLWEWCVGVRDPSNPSQIKEPKCVRGGRSIKPNSCDSKHKWGVADGEKTCMSMRRNRRVASWTGCLASPRHSTTEGTRAVLKWLLESTAAESRTWSGPWETLKLLSEEKCVGRREENWIK